jgi:1,4-dihydroxy-2-naphthoate octaprenyltransferase
MATSKTGKPNPWLLAARTRTLPASIAPVLVGTALAAREGRFQLLPFLATLAAAVLLQVGANYANDVFDFLKGADKNRVGPTRVTQSGLVTPRQMLIGTAVVFGLAMLIGVYLVSVGGWVILGIGLFAILAALAYTAGPFPLAYNGLGDAFAFVFFGLIAVTGTYYLQAGHFSALALAASLPVALLVTNIIVVNNLRDIDTDRAANKRTLAVRIGDRATRIEYLAFMGLAYLVPVALGAAYGRWLWLLPLLSAPIALKLGQDMWRSPRSPALNPILGRSAQLNLIVAALFAAGLLLAN